VETNIRATSYTCIVCGEKWGGHEETGTSGICIKCFAKWALKNYQCFGSYNEKNMNCITCKISKYCREYYDDKK